ncbi:MAG: hypothetical protein V4702_01475 [Patescibacteria group bacterium]
MRAKQTRAALMCSVGLFAGSWAGCGSEQAPRVEAASPTAGRRGPGSTAVSTTIEIVPPTTTTTLFVPTTEPYTLEPPLPMSEAQKQENASIIENQIRASLDSIGVPLVIPDETIAKVTDINEFIVPVGNCGAIISMDDLVIVVEGATAATTMPTTQKKLNLRYYGDLAILANGNSYTEANMHDTHNKLMHADPGSLGNPFDPNDADSTNHAVVSIVQTVADGCLTGVANNYGQSP